MRVEYACLDGSPFPVVFADRGDLGLRWVVDREHAPTAMTPLADAVRRVGRLGGELAYAESGLPMPSTLAREPPQANGYDYYVDDWLPQADRDDFEARPASSRRPARRHTRGLAEPQPSTRAEGVLVALGRTARHDLSRAGGAACVRLESHLGRRSRRAERYSAPWAASCEADLR